MCTPTLVNGAKAPTSQAIHLASRESRRVLTCRAQARVDIAAVAPPTQRQRSGSMIRSLAAAVELNGQVQRYETLAGRSAMVGVAVAACIEVVTDHGIFFPVNSDTALTYACIAAATMAAAVGVALANGQNDATTANDNTGILESVYASLTAVQRSAASVTQAQVDKAVDCLLEAVLESRFDAFSIEGLIANTDDEL